MNEDRIEFPHIGVLFGTEDRMHGERGAFVPGMDGDARRHGTLLLDRGVTETGRYALTREQYMARNEVTCVTS